MSLTKVDLAPWLWHGVGMIWLRHAFILVLVVALLPWGALASARVAGSVVVPLHAVDDSRIGPAVPDVQLAKVKRPCRTGILPGGCGWDARVDAVTAGVTPAPRAARPGPERPDLRAGLVPPPLIGPPRAV